MSLAVFVSEDGGAMARVARGAFAAASPAGWDAIAARELTPGLEVRADLLVAIGETQAGDYALGTVERWPLPGAVDVLEGRVREVVDRRLSTVPGDRTAHQRRLATVLPELARDFSPPRSAAEIRACAEAVLTPVEDAILARFADARWRTRMLAVADRQTRECLRGEVCTLVEDRAAASPFGSLRVGGRS